MGIKNVVGLTTGAEGFHQSWYDRLERFKTIYLVMDNDIAGQDGAVKISKRLGTTSNGAGSPVGFMEVMSEMYKK